MADLILKPGKERSVIRRHPWIFAGSVERLEGRARPGDTVLVKDADGRALARALEQELLALGMDINDEQMIELVYPSMSIQPDSLRKTYKKNALVFKELGCFNSWKRKLSQLSLWDKPVSEVLEMDF